MRILVYLAAREGRHPVSRREIADAEDITPAYIEQVLSSLKASGFIRSVRVVKGGFMLGKAPENISVADVVEATEGALALVPCITSNCEKAAASVVKAVWKRAGEALKQEMARATIAKMAAQLKCAGKSGTAEFEI